MIDESWPMFESEDEVKTFRIGQVYRCGNICCFKMTQEPKNWKLIPGYDSFFCPECYSEFSYDKCSNANDDIDLCERCGHELELCIANFPWSDEHWICGNCDSTYNIEDVNGKLTRTKLKGVNEEPSEV